MKIFKILWTMVLVSILLGACSTQKGTENASLNQEKLQEMAFINPPIPGAETKFTAFELDAEKGGEFKYATGTTITVPANALTDQEGKPIKGKVTLQYREFHDALDVLLSGIPMEYDSAKVKKNFQTAGMYEINAHQNNKTLQIAKDQKIKIKMASWQPESDYNFYQLDTARKNWAYQSTSKPEINLEKATLKYALEAKKPAALSDMLILNYGQALDIAFNFDWKQVNANETAFRAKLDQYQLQYWNGIRADSEINFQGNKYPAFDMVWKMMEQKNIPQWVKKEEVHWRNVNITPLGAEIYQLTINHSKDKIFTLKVKPLMRIAGLLKFPPNYWKTQYAQAMEQLRIEEEKIAKVADVFRLVEVSQFGIYNYDRYLKDREEDVVVVAADFKMEKAKDTPNMVYYINNADRAVMKYTPSQWEKVALVPDSTVRIFAVMSDYSIAVYDKGKYQKIGFKALKAQEKPKQSFELSQNGDIAKNKEDLKKALSL
jgi:hypothetical protein